MLRLICELHQVHTGDLTIACDNISTLRVFEPWFIPDPSQESFDLVKCLKTYILRCPITLHPRHVHGHQDSIQGVSLSRLEALNVEADRLAGNYRLMIEQSNPNCTASSHTVAYEGFSIWVGDTKLSSPNRQTLYREIHRPRMMKKWNHPGHFRQLRFPAACNNTIDWPAVRRFMLTLLEYTATLLYYTTLASRYYS